MYSQQYNVILHQVPTDRQPIQGDDTNTRPQRQCGLTRCLQVHPPLQGASVAEEPRPGGGCPSAAPRLGYFRRSSILFQGQCACRTPVMTGEMTNQGRAPKL